MTLTCVAGTDLFQGIFLQGTKLTSKQSVFLPPQMKSSLGAGSSSVLPFHLSGLGTFTGDDNGSRPGEAQIRQGTEGFQNEGYLQQQLAEARRTKQ